MKPERILRRLVDSLPDAYKTHQQYINCVEYVAHGEWELALDSLIELAEETGDHFSNQHWQGMADTAAKMNLTRAGDYCREQIKRNQRESAGSVGIDPPLSQNNNTFRHFLALASWATGIFAVLLAGYVAYRFIWPLAHVKLVGVELANPQNFKDGFTVEVENDEDVVAKLSVTLVVGGDTVKGGQVSIPKGLNAIFISAPELFFPDEKFKATVFLDCENCVNSEEQKTRELLRHSTERFKFGGVWIDQKTGLDSILISHAGYDDGGYPVWLFLDSSKYTYHGVGRYLSDSISMEVKVHYGDSGCTTMLTYWLRRKDTHEIALSDKVEPNRCGDPAWDHLTSGPFVVLRRKGVNVVQ
jgi:hypothetical protein